MNAPLRRDYRHDITGAQMPGSTDLVGLLAGDVDGLCWAAHHLAREGKTFRVEWDEKKEIGTLAHVLIEQTLRGEPINPPVGTPAERIIAAGFAHRAWLAWRDAHALVPMSVERALKSSLWGYGATHDFIGGIDNVITIADWKTGELNDKHIIQLALNVALWEGNGGARIERGLLVQCPIDGEDAREVEIPRRLIDAAQPACAALLTLHKCLPTIKLPRENE